MEQLKGLRFPKKQASEKTSQNAEVIQYIARVPHLDLIYVITLKQEVSHITTSACQIDRTRKLGLKGLTCTQSVILIVPLIFSSFLVSAECISDIITMMSPFFYGMEWDREMGYLPRLGVRSPYTRPP